MKEGILTKSFEKGTPSNSLPWNDEKKEMQKFVMNNPHVLFPMLPDDKKIKMLARELKTSNGDVDFALVDEDGSFYIVETKLKKNTDKRKIFAQVDDYASSIWYKLKINQDIEDFFRQCEKTLQKYRNDQTLTLDSYLKDEFDPDDGIDEFKKRIIENIKKNKLTFIIVMDELDEKIKTQIIYRTIQEIKTYGVELVQFKNNDELLIVPQIFQVSATSDSSGKSGDWVNDDVDATWIWEKYGNHVKTNTRFTVDLKNAIVKLCSKFQEWDGDPYLNLSSKQIDFGFKNVENWKTTPVIIFPDGALSLRPEAFKEEEKRKGFQKNISDIDEFIQNKITTTKGMKIKIPIEIWAPKVEIILNVLEKYCK